MRLGKPANGDTTRALLHRKIQGDIQGVGKKVLDEGKHFRKARAILRVKLEV